MARKGTNPTFSQILDQFRAQSFEVAQSSAAPGAVQVSRSGIAAILVASGAAKARAARQASLSRPAFW